MVDFFSRISTFPVVMRKERNIKTKGLRDNYVIIIAENISYATPVGDPLRRNRLHPNGKVAQLDHFLFRYVAQPPVVRTSGAAVLAWRGTRGCRNRRAAWELIPGKCSPLSLRYVTSIRKRNMLTGSSSDL